MHTKRGKKTKTTLTSALTYHTFRLELRSKTQFRSQTRYDIRSEVCYEKIH